MLKAVKEETKQTKKLQALRRDSNDPEAVDPLASTFHYLVQRSRKRNMYKGEEAN